MKLPVMKRKILTLNFHGCFFMALMLLLLVNAARVYSGDAWILDINIRKAFYIEDSKPVSVTFRNDEAYDVTDMSVDISIFFQTGPSSWDLKFNWSQTGITVPAQSDLEVSTGAEEFSPDKSGLYQLYVTSFSPVDIDPSNNNLNFDFLAGKFLNFNLGQVNFKEPYQIDNSAWAYLYTKVPIRDKLWFFNVMARNTDTEQEAWVVKNMPVLPYDGISRFKYPFNLGDLGYEDGDDVDSLDIVIREDTLQINEPFDAYDWFRLEIKSTDYNVPADNEPFYDLNADLPAMVTFPAYDAVKVTHWNYRGCKVPNIDLDSSEHKPDGTYAGDWNACGPAAAANSLQWLEDSFATVPSTGKSHREKMEEISGFMNRGNECGVNTEQLAKGKLGFIDKYKLPISVKYQSWWNQDDSIPSPNGNYSHSAKNMHADPSVQKPPTWEFLKSEMEKGEDVEILFGWYDHGAHRNGGHWVTVTGVSEVSNGNKGIYVKDDWEQADSAGTREIFLTWQVDGNWSRLVGYDGPNNYCWVESVVSESYDPDVTFPPESITEKLADKPGNLNLTIRNNPVRLYEDVLIDFEIKQASDLEVEIFNMEGQRIAALIPGTYDAGPNKLVLPARLFSANSGDYIIVFKTKDSIATRKLIVY
jgi:hypothetical protein